MRHEEAALLGGVRQAVDNMLVRFAAVPAFLMRPPPTDEMLLNLMTSLVTTTAIHEVEQPDQPHPPL